MHTAGTYLAGKFPTVTEDEVEKTLKRIRRGRAAGDDGITVDILKIGGA